MSYNPLPEDVNSNVMTRISQHDIFDQIITTNRNTQIEAAFFSPTAIVSDFVQIEKTGSADATMAAGKAIFSSGSDTSCSVSAKTFSKILYTPGFEIYSIFTITFTTPTSVNSSQLVGLWDTVNNGFFIGYDGTTFVSGVLNGGVKTVTPRSSWNGDKLDGSVTSKFTRNGLPEAINFNNLNLYRIRFGWLGAAPVLYEVCSPDGVWVTFHTVIQPNASPLPSIEDPNLPITLKITKSAADTTNLIMTCSCWAGGTAAPINPSITGFSRETWSALTTVGETVESSVTVVGNVSLSIINSGSISAGVVTFEVSPDGLNWFPLQLNSPNGVYNQTTYNLALGSSTFQSYVGGYIKIRGRLSTPIAGTGTSTIEIRPSNTSAIFNVGVFQPTGSNLHTIVDSGNITTASSSSSANAPTSVSIGVASTPVLPANTLRKGLVLTNTSNRVISLGLHGASAILNSGITLQPGGVWVMDSYTFTTGAVSAIASAAASNLAVQEFQ